MEIINKIISKTTPKYVIPLDFKAGESNFNEIDNLKILKNGEILKV
jgi:hypothetical protein